MIVGGGLAGAAAATHLAQAGCDVLLLERACGPHDKVCGEFLSYEAQEDLAGLEIDVRSFGAVPIRTAAVLRGRSRIETPLPFEGLSLSRRILDEALLDRAARAGAEVRRGLRATTFGREGGTWAVGLEGGERLLAREVMLATGKHDLKGWRRPTGQQPDLLGFKAYWRIVGDSPLGEAVELHLFPSGYAGLQRVEGGRANLCLVVYQGAFVALGGRWEALLAHLLSTCPALAVTLDGAEPCGARPLAIAAIPYGFVQERGEGIWRLGDQAAVIPSFTGEGMSIALHSARLAAACLLAGERPEAFQRRLAEGLRGQVRRATAASRALVSPMPQVLVGRFLTPAMMRWVLRRTRIPNAARAV